MREGWETETLGEVCEMIKRGVAPKYTEEDGLCVINQKCVRNHEIDLTLSRKHNLNIKAVNPERLIRVGDVLVNSTGQGTLGRVAQVRETPEAECTVDTHVTIVRPKPHLFYNDFFGYALIKIEDEITDSGEGSSGQTELSRTKLRDNFQISYPKSLESQRKIVAVLDEAFAAIDKARANVERNIENSRELFQSKLNEVFSREGERWEEKRLGAVCERVSVGHVGSTSKFYCDEGGVPFIRSQNVRRGFIDLSNIRHITVEFHEKLKKSQLKKGDVLFVRVGANRGDCSAITEELGNINCANIVFARPLSENSKYIEYYFLSPTGRDSLLGLTTGSAQGVINTKLIKNTYVPFPSKKEQEAIIEKLDFYQSEVDQLLNQYDLRLNHLESLKKSILQKAFAGELVQGTSQLENIITFIPKVKSISPTDLHIGIIALAYQKHEELDNLKTLGHTKTEKIVHLAEYHVGVGMDRNPRKDAAGPNDFVRVNRKVEPRAKNAGYFTVTSTVNKGRRIYSYDPGSNFQNIIDKTNACLTKSQRDKLDKLLGHFAKMNTRQAELVATVYAAWNNLLIQNLAVTDEAIVWEAREDWHENKLNIPRVDFFETLKWMRQPDVNLVPTGRGKLVEKKPT